MPISTTSIKKSYFEQLPREVRIMIFNYVDIFSLYYAVRLINKDSYSLTQKLINERKIRIYDEIHETLNELFQGIVKKRLTLKECYQKKYALVSFTQKVKNDLNYAHVLLDSPDLCSKFIKSLLSNHDFCEIYMKEMARCLSTEITLPTEYSYQQIIPYTGDAILNTLAT